MARIVLTGSPGYLGKEVDEESATVIRLTDGWYHKKDPAVICLNNRFYRRNSPLLAVLNERYYGNGCVALKEQCTLYDDQYLLTRDFTEELVISVVNDEAVLTTELLPTNFMSFKFVNYIDEKGEKIICRIRPSDSMNLSKIMIKTVLGAYCSNKNIGLVEIMSDSIVSIDDDIKSCKKYCHKSETDVLIRNYHLIEFEGNLWWGPDLFFTHDHNGSKVRAIGTKKNIQSLNEADRNKFLSEYCREERIFNLGGGKATMEGVTLGNIDKRILDNSCIDKSNELFYINEFNAYCKHDIDLIIKKYGESSKGANASAVVIENNYFDQPIPKRCVNIATNEGGNYLYHESSIRNIDISGGKILTGNCGYTFGVELETSVGLLPRVLVEKLSLKGVGDRSIGAIEYVTKPLYGNKGMLLLRQTVEELAKYTGVDKRCGIHVHIGGSGKDESPEFNRSFSVHAIKLACMIESEMFEIVPPERTASKNREGLAYCGRFADQFSDISKDNWREMLGKFVFGHPYSDEHNKKTKLNRWISSRYKWLNLVNCNSNNEGRSDAGTKISRFETIEFRLWDGSLVWEDVYSFIIISMAFTKYVENHQRNIMKYKEISISEIVSSTMRQDVANNILSWIDSRKEKVKNLTKTNKKQS